MRPSLVDHFEPAQTGEQGQQRQAHDGEEVAFDFLDQLRAATLDVIGADTRKSRLAHLRHVPAKYKDEAPVVVNKDGIDTWMYQGKPQGVSGLNAVVSWPPEEWAKDPAGFAEMRPGAYDVHERIRDMDRNGILASMCFPTFAGFSARHLNQHRQAVTLVMVSSVTGSSV